MIIINGKPIFNCLDFYENVDINQLLLQKAEFYNFALRHMQFDKVNKACINVLKEACENPGSLKMCNERVFWYIGNQEIDGSIIREKNILLSYAFEKFEGLSVSDRFFIGAVLLLCPNAYEVMDKMSESVTNEEGFLSFQGDGDEYILSAGERFSARINPALKIEDGEEMKVWKLKAFGNAQRGAVITACDQSGAEFEVFPGIIQYVLACRGQIVNVLDNSSCDKDNKLYRGKNCIYDKDGSSTDVPYDCISFAP
ncbi:MAG: hypothetical protein IKU60_05435, partial [Clostridia bacterium]|nr:hypothetical protein [Clostridia bacterium]